MERGCIVITLITALQKNTATYMMDREDKEGPSPRTLGDDGQEARVGSTEVVVLDAACDRNAIIAALFGGGLTEHVTKLGAAVLGTPCHLR